MTDRSRRRVRLLWSMLAASVLVSGCGSSYTSAPASTSAVPTGAALLSTSAAAMKTVTSAHFTLAVTGKVPALQVQGAEGDLTSTGNAQGNAKITQFGQLVQVEFVFVGQDLYLKGAPGGFTKLAAALAGQVYDPTAILNADKGVAKMLASVKNPATPATAGSAYTVSGTVPKAIAASLVPGISTDVMGTFTIDQATSRLTHITLALTGADSKPAAVDMVLSDLNKVVTITAPA